MFKMGISRQCVMDMEEAEPSNTSILAYNYWIKKFLWSILLWKIQETSKKGQGFENKINKWVNKINE